MKDGVARALRGQGLRGAARARRHLLPHAGPDRTTTRAVCVVLSGTGANGSMGVKRVKEMGGVVLVQDPREAEYSDMPRNSIATGLVDYVLPVAEIPAKIIAYRDRNLNEVSIPVEEPERRGSRRAGAARHLHAAARAHAGTTSRTTSARPCCAASSAASASRTRGPARLRALHARAPGGGAARSSRICSSA